MPTVNQLVRKGRGSKTRKSKAPVLLVGVNTIRRKQTLIFLVLDITYKSIVLY